jgi:poly(3-hydroxybutyrate) depolymerase
MALTIALIACSASAPPGAVSTGASGSGSSGASSGATSSSGSGSRGATGASSTPASGNSGGAGATGGATSGSAALSGQVSQGTDASMSTGATGLMPEAGPETGSFTGDANAMTMGPFPSGPSAGCGMAPPTSAGTTNMKIQTVSVPSCGAGPITPACVAPAFSPGGADYLKVQQWDFNNRNYGIELPANYDPMKPYPVILEGGGCTAGPTTLGGGFSAGEGTSAIRIGLSYVGQCFADGGVGNNNGFGCAVDEAHIADCVATPEVPYVNTVLDYVESHLCVDLGKVFIGGLSSGAWEASTVSCALANRVRGMTTVAGGLRINRPLCQGPTAAFMIVDGGDNSNPIGPMMAGQALPAVGLSAAQVSSDITSLDSHGSAPMRDELLNRNGCQGTATAVYPGYPQCMTYTGCPAAYPVVWCFMPGEGHGGSFYQNVNYGPGAWTFFSQLPAP